jgi:cell division protein FtsZ
VYIKPETKPFQKEERSQEEPSYTFTLFERTEVTASQDGEDEDEGEDSLFKGDDDEFSVEGSISSDQYLDEEGMIEYRKTKERLIQQAKERREKLKSGKTQEMSKEDFKQKWDTPAYQRRGVKMDNIPHSSEPLISRYNLNDDNNLLGNNKFLHDNVD